MMKVTVLLLATFALIATARTEQPILILLLSDDQSWAGLSVPMHPDLPGSKHPYFETPNLEKLAEEGMVFSAAYAPASACSPTRISLQTGRSPAALQWCKAAPVFVASDGFRLIPPPSRKSILSEEITIAELLKSVGYATAHFGKWHLQGGGPEAHGYDVSDGNTGNQDAAPFKDPNPVDIFGMCRRTTDFAAEQKGRGKPFFAQLSFHALHYPENASAKNTAKYRSMNPRAQEKEIGRGALTTDLDEGIGELLAGLEEHGLTQSTYVIYLSDNGNGGGKRMGLLQGGKGSLYEGGIRVPMIVRGPGIKPGSYSHERVVGYDLFPTFCSLAGVAVPANAQIEGVDLTGVWHGETEKLPARPRGGIGFHFPHYQGSPPQSAWYSGEYKLLRDYESGRDALYRIDSDPGERNDLSKSEPDLIAKLAGELDQWLVALEAGLLRNNPEVDPAKADSWRAAGKAQKKGRKGGKR